MKKKVTLTNYSMQKEQALQYITNGMSLRTPQEKSLVLFAEYLESDAGKKVLARMKKENRGGVVDIEQTTKEYTQSLTDLKQFQAFERTFPAYTFALATGVGKTRLMGAFVAYLYLVFGVQHFMIVAPGNTIYRKLVDDFSKASNPKYVFRGIEELSASNVKVITKDNYGQSQMAQLFANKIEINIFNIQQFAQTDIEKEKGITKFSETLGESYFEYLNSLDDLVIMMDESHHYHADAAMHSLDRIDPLFGLEFTATPYTGNMIGRGRQKQPEMMHNIFYAYNLGSAIRDGYVKDPWVGTEADVDFSQRDPESIDTDARKLQLAAFFHERAKVALEEYALENNRGKVKPVMLVVAKDTAHADELYTLMNGDGFRGGTFKGKVIKVHTKTRGEETDENIEKLISLEHPDNIVEIVIHVNMLKEGWDVTNIYTIAPIRSSASEILTEQTIGRGLRLPYGEKTGNKLVDRVMIVAHEKFEKVIEEAKNSKLIQPSNIESVSSEEAKVVKEVLEVPSIFVATIEAQIKASPAIMQEIQMQAAKTVGAEIGGDTPEDVKVATIQNKVDEIVEATAKNEANKLSFAAFHKHTETDPSTAVPYEEGSLFSVLSEPAKKELENIGRISRQTIETRNIPIPRLMLTPHYGELVIDNFDLDVKKLSRYATDASIIEQSLQGKEQKDLFGVAHEGHRETELTRVSSLGEGRTQSPENTIIAVLVDSDHPLIDYDEQKELLIKLARQTTAYYKSFVGDVNALKMMVENNTRQIANEIYAQILEHKHYKSESYLESGIREPKPYLEQYKISQIVNEKPVTLESQLDRFSRDKIYTGFSKACHSMYKFDSSDEARMAYLLDKESSVEDWLRPAPNQFEGLYWRDEVGNSQHRYEPDFVVELKDEIVMVEVKPQEEIKDFDVQEKKKTADKYCELVSKSVGKYGIAKPWRYVVVPTENISIQSTVGRLLRSSV